jgi:hypothetical protein
LRSILLHLLELGLEGEEEEVGSRDRHEGSERANQEEGESIEEERQSVDNK